MKKIKQITMLFIAVLSVSAMSAQDKKPLSPPVTATGNINGANITIHYSSPSVKGRAIWGGLVPYDKVWRAGANDATTFTTDKDIMVEGKKLPAGTYAFFVLPQNDGITIIFNKEAKQWGAYNYKEAKDQLRVNVKAGKAPKMYERLTYDVNKDNVTLNWENWAIPVKIK